MNLKSFERWHNDSLKTRLTLLDQWEAEVRQPPNWSLSAKAIAHKSDRIASIQRQRSAILRVLANREANEQQAQPTDYKAAALAFAKAFDLARAAYWASVANNGALALDKYWEAYGAINDLPIATIEELLGSESKEK